MARKDVHVVPSGDRWKVEDQGDTREFDSQQQAEQFGRERAREAGAEFFLHGRDGQIRERDSYGNDPRDIPG